MNGIGIETDLKIMDYVRENSIALIKMMGDSSNDKIHIYNRDWDKKKYVKMSELTLSELMNLSADLYPCSFYQEDREDNEDYGKWILLIRSKSWSLIQEIQKYANDHWSDIKDAILHDDNGVFSEGHDIMWLSPYDITWDCKNRDDGLTTYNVYLNGVGVGNFVD